MKKLKNVWKIDSLFIAKETKEEICIILEEQCSNTMYALILQWNIDQEIAELQKSILST